MKNLYDVFGTEEDLEVNGVWLDYGVAKIKIARTGNKNTEYLKVFKKVMKRYGKKSYDMLEDSEHDAILAETFAKGVIREWQFKDKDGKWKSGLQVMEKGKLTEVPYTWENVRKCLLDLPDLFADLRRQADDIKTFQKEVEDNQLKN